MSEKIAIDFGPDKSQILRGIAIIFMIALHNHTTGLFKICVPIFTFLVGYGYAFAKEKNLRHAVKRSWHLLSHFWLILLGICLPVGILAGGFKPTLGNVIPEMFGLESELNWYSWYVHFYIWAMIAMIPSSIIIKKFGILGVISLCILCAIGCIVVHHFPGWDSNIWTQAIFDCFLCSPPMVTGFYLAEGGVVTKIRIHRNFWTVIVLIVIMSLTFMIRGIPYVTFFDFIIVPVFCCATIALFNIISWQLLHKILICLGIESMNMWFVHALFATACTAVLFAPVIMWIHPKVLLIISMITLSYLSSKILTKVYNVF